MGSVVQTQKHLETNLRSRGLPEAPGRPQPRSRPAASARGGRWGDEGTGKAASAPPFPAAARHSRHLPEPPRSAPGSDALRLSRNPLPGRERSSRAGKGAAGPAGGCRRARSSPAIPRAPQSEGSGLASPWARRFPWPRRHSLPALALQGRMCEIISFLKRKCPLVHFESGHGDLLVLPLRFIHHEGRRNA